MSPVPPIVGQPLDSDPSTLEIPQAARPDQSTLQTSRYAGAHTPSLDDLVSGIISNESGGNPEARGKKGEIGLAQIMPATAVQYGVPAEALSHPEVNKMVAKRYLGDLINRYQGDVGKALAAYNAGPGNVDKGNIPGSTKSYVRRVLEHIGGGVSTLMGEGTASAEEMPPSVVRRDPVNIDAMMRDPRVARLTDEQRQTLRQRAETANEALLTPEQRTDRAHPWYAKFRGPATELTARGIEGLGQFPQSFLSGHPLRPFTEAPSEQARWGARTFVVPQTPRDAAIQAALLASGVGEAKLGLPALEKIAATLPGRVVLPAVAGALGSAVSGENPLAGLAAGAGTGLGGEALRLPFGVAGRALGKNPLLRETGEQVAGEVGKSLPVETPASQMERLFTRGKVVDQVNEATRPVFNQVEAASRGVPFSAPELSAKGKIGANQNVSYSQALDRLEELGDLGYVKGQPKNPVAAARARRAYGELRKGIQQRLEEVQVGLGDQWAQARKQQGVAKAMTRLFAPKNKVLNLTGTQVSIDQPQFVIALQKNFPDLERQLGPAQAEALFQKATRNSTGALQDLLSETPHVRMGLLGLPHVSGLPRTTRPVGDVPLWINPPRYPFAAFGAAPLIRQGEQ